MLRGSSHPIAVRCVLFISRWHASCAILQSFEPALSLHAVPIGLDAEQHAFAVFGSVMFITYIYIYIYIGTQLPSGGPDWHALREGAVPSCCPPRSADLSYIIALLMHPDPAQRPTAGTLHTIAHQYQLVQPLFIPSWLRIKLPLKPAVLLTAVLWRSSIANAPVSDSCCSSENWHARSEKSSCSRLPL